MRNHWTKICVLLPGNGLSGNASRAVAVLLSTVLISSAAVASSLGMVTDNASDELRVFDVATDATLASLKGVASRVSLQGDLQLAGNRLSSGAQPNNANCAPGSKAGVLLDRNGGLT